MTSESDAYEIEVLNRRVRVLRHERDVAETQAVPAPPPTPEQRFERAARLVQLRKDTEDRLVEANRDRGRASASLMSATLAGSALKNAAVRTVRQARLDAVRIVERARAVAAELERTARRDAEAVRVAADAEVATLRDAAIREVADARRLRVEAQHLHDDAQKRWLAANEAMHQAAARLPSPTMAGSHDDMIWLTDDDSIEELDDRFEKYFALELNDDSAREWMLGGRGK